MCDYLWFQIPMNVTQLVQFVDTDKHFRDVEPRVFFFEYTRVVEEGTEITSCDEIHCEVDVEGILERVEESN